MELVREICLGGGRDTKAEENEEGELMTEDGMEVSARRGRLDHWVLF